MSDAELDASHMARALELAALGQGRVEPNPMVGCTIVHGGETVGEGWHQQFGGLHAEIMALEKAGPRALGATVYVTLEPCCHHGKTPPCTDALISAGVRRVVAAQLDPFGQVSGRGIEALRGAGIAVEVGLLEEAARELNAPYRMRIEQGRPWIIAKWAMSLDGKIATRTGDSRWISSEASRAIVHALRGRVDAIMIGRGTAERDDPLLTARPAGVRTAARIVVDSHARLSAQSQLARTAGQVPVLVAVSHQAPGESQRRLRDCGCEVLVCEGTSAEERLAWLLHELAGRGMTNVLVEGGGQLLGSLHDVDALDEIHVFVAPILIGGRGAAVPLGGEGIDRLVGLSGLASVQVCCSGRDAYIHGRIVRG